MDNWFLDRMSWHYISEKDQKTGKIVSCRFVGYCMLCGYRYTAKTEFDIRRFLVAHLLSAHYKEYQEHVGNILGER